MENLPVALIIFPGKACFCLKQDAKHPIRLEQSAEYEPVGEPGSLADCAFLGNDITLTGRHANLEDLGLSEAQLAAARALAGR